MVSALTTTTSGDGQLSEFCPQWNRGQIDLIKNQIAKGCSDDELMLFGQVCQRTGLDPFNRQIYAITRNVWNPETRSTEPKMSIQVSIDGFRLIADRSGKYGGSETFWCGQDGQWVDVWLSIEPPAAAKTCVYRNDSPRPFVGVAKFDSYKQEFKDKKSGEMKLSSMWEKMPEVMIAKCSEALALRKAFPAELSGLYTREEMMQADTEIVNAYQPQGVPVTAPAKQIAPGDIKQLYAIAKNHGWTKEALLSLVRDLYDLDSFNDLSRAQYDEICDKLIPSKGYQGTYLDIPQETVEAIGTEVVTEF